MKAFVYTEYGSPDVLQLKEVEKPTPKADEVLIRVMATAVNAVDWRLLRANPFFVRFFAGLLKPKYHILGADVSGLVEAVGQNVTQFQPGDAVFGDLAGAGFGGFAEYVCAPETMVAAKPATLSFAQAAAVPMAALTALQGLRDIGKIRPGHNVLIHGASGGVGTFAVQIAKALGGVVTAVCSTTKVETARSLGAEHVIDYTKEDFTLSGQQYDLILAANGYRKLADYAAALTPTGIYVMAGGSMSQMFQAILLGPLKSRTGGKTFHDFTAKPSQADLLVVKELIEAGKITPVIDQCYPLSQTQDAMRHLETGHAKGKIVILIQETQA